MNRAAANKNHIPSIAAVLVGAASILFVYWLHNLGGFLVFLSFVLFAFVSGFKQRLIPWKLTFLLLASNYIAGFFCIPSWGELLPIDIAFLFVSWGICGLAGKLGIYFGGKYNVSRI